jgi:cell wall-associated NlpC family hydrolase
MSALVASARKYLGVPFKHRGRTPNGLDCAGLAWLAYADLGYTPPDLTRYGSTPFRDGLMQAMQAALGAPVWCGRAVPRDVLQVGDVVVMRFVEEPHHVAIVCDSTTHGVGLLHCYGNIGYVVEHGLDAMWQARILAVFRRPV